MILYFSGTGNSQYVAIQMAKMLADEVVSMNQYLKKGGQAVIHSERPLVFVTPTYSWRMPRVVEQWILKTEFSGCRDTYFILTCGDDCGNAAAYARKICEKKGLHYCGLTPVAMPENYLALFSTPSESECQKIVEKAGPGISVLGSRIQSGQPLSDTPASFGDKLKSGPIYSLFYTFIVHDKGFTVSSACTSCQKCAKRCPLNNIEIVDGKPRWRGNCTHCMACIAGCPAKAIEYKTKSKGQHRHYIMNDSLCRGNGGQEQ